MDIRHSETVENEREHGRTSRIKTAWSHAMEGLRARSMPAGEVLAWVLYGVMAFLFGRCSLLFGAAPLGVGLICSVKRRAPAVGAGLLASAFVLGPAGWIYGTVYLLAVTLRLLFSLPGEGRWALPDCDRFFGELPALRISAACICGVAAAGYQLFVGGITTEGLLFGGTMILVCPLSCFLFGLYSDREQPARVLFGRQMPDALAGGHALLWQAGLLSLIFATSYAARDIIFFGFSLSAVTAAAAAIYAAYRFGAIHGFAAGAVCGLAYGYTYAPAFALLGLISGVLQPVGLVFSLALGLSAGTVWCSFVGGLQGFLTVFPELAAVSVISLPLLKRPGEPPRTRDGAAQAQQTLQEMKRHGTGGTDAAMMKLSGALTSLSKLLESYREATDMPDTEVLRAVCAEACTKRCGGCAAYEGCWEAEDAPGIAMTERMALAYSEGRMPEVSLLGQAMAERCGSSRELVEDIRAGLGDFLRLSKSNIDAQTVAPEYEMAAGMLRETVRTDRENSREDTRLAADISRMMRSDGHGAAVSVCGKRKKIIRMALEGAALNDEKAVALRRELEVLCGCRLTDLKREEADGVNTVTAETDRELSARGAVSMRSAAPEQASGDSVRFFETADGMYVAVMADGMGTGDAAAAVSGMGAVFMEKLMQAGCGTATAVGMLNGLVRRASNRTSTTLDVFTLDLLNGDGLFVKAGAAPSYILRGEKVFRIRSKTVPLGLCEKADTERTKFHVEAGDVVIMLSDGISACPEDTPWLIELLGSLDRDADPSALASVIMGEAEAHGGRSDDMTAAVIVISPNMRR